MQNPLETQTQLEKGILFLAGRCDFASSHDGKGFSRYDADFGHSLADRLAKGWCLTERQAASAKKLANKYRKQLTEGGFDMELVLDSTPRQFDKVAFEQEKQRKEKDRNQMVEVFFEVIGDSQKAIRVLNATDDKVWIPLSLCKDIEKVGGGIWQAKVPQWIKDQKGL